MMSAACVYECGPFSRLPPPALLSLYDGEGELGGSVIDPRRLDPLSLLFWQQGEEHLKKSI